MIITLTGNNDYLIKQTLAQLADQFVNKFGVHSVERVSGEELDPSRLSELLQGTSLFAAERLVVMRDAAKNKALWDALADWLQRIPAETTLAIVEPVPDKRTKTYKLLAKLSDMRELGDRSESELVAWLQQLVASLGGNLDTPTARYLVNQVGTDQWRLSQEVEKLVNFDPAITTASIDELVEATPQASAFELLDGALGRKPKIVKSLLEKLTTTEDPYRFFGLLTSQVQALAVVKSAGDRTADTIAKEAGLHPFVVRKTQGLARSVESADVKAIIDSVALCDTQLKSTGADPWMLLEQCLSKLATR